MNIGNKTILLVEDDQMLGEMLNRKLKSEGAKIIWASDGLDALEKIKIGEIDLIMTDLLMPKLDGLEMLKRIKEMPNTKDIPFIMLTVKDLAEEEVNKMKDIGLDDYIVKTNVQLEDVLTKVEDILNK